LRLQSLQKRGIDGNTKLRADAPGLSSKVYVQPGAIVPAGDPLIDLVSEDRLEARLEVEPEDIGYVRSGQSVSISYANVPTSHEVTGKIRKISRAVDPGTRLVDVFVFLPRSASFLLGEYVVGRITVASSRGWVVPRSGVLPADGRYMLYTVENGHAIRHIVHVGLENDEEIEVLGQDLRLNQEVVVLGNHELTEGMAVEVVTSK
jgi:membrane fusion protein (multidrug efflux system)